MQDAEETADSVCAQYDLHGNGMSFFLLHMSLMWTRSALWRLQMGLAVGLQITAEWSMRVEIRHGVNALKQLTLDYSLYVHTS